MAARFLMAVALTSIGPGVFAGVFAGSESDHNETTIQYFGLQTETPLFISLFHGNLEYQYQDGNSTVKVESTIFSPMIGYRRDGDVSASLAIGASQSDEKEIRGSTSTLDTRTGAVVQAMLSRWRPEANHQFFASYDDTAEFVSTRASGKYRLAGRWFGGAEVFWMGNDDFRSQGIGGLLEWSGRPLSLQLKMGVSAIREGNTGVYGGVSLYVPFES